MKATCISQLWRKTVTCVARSTSTKEMNAELCLWWSVFSKFWSAIFRIWKAQNKTMKRARPSTLSEINRFEHWVRLNWTSSKSSNSKSKWNSKSKRRLSGFPWTSSRLVKAHALRGVWHVRFKKSIKTWQVSKNGKAHLKNFACIEKISSVDGFSSK